MHPVRGAESRHGSTESQSPEIPKSAPVYRALYVTVGASDGCCT